MGSIPDSFDDWGGIPEFSFLSEFSGSV